MLSISMQKWSRQSYIVWGKNACMVVISVIYSENLEDYNYTHPEDPEEGVNQNDVELWKKQPNLYWMRKGIYQDNRMEFYSLTWGQSPKTMISNLEMLLNFTQCSTSYDSLELL
jgi:hypothetical protein